MRHVKYWIYIKYLLLIVSYSLSILMHSLLTTLPFDIFMSIQLRELFNEFVKMIMCSLAINITISFVTIGVAYVINVIVGQIKCQHKVQMDDNCELKNIMQCHKDNLDILNPFLYGSKTRCLLE